MKKIFFYLFILIFIADIVLTATENDQWRYYTKPLLMPALAGYFIAGTLRLHSGLRILMIAALAFSWCGDVLLMFQDKDPLYFLAGLSLFLIAHIFYIGYFHRARQKEDVDFRWWQLPVIAIYYGLLIALLYPGLEEMKIPVAVYGVVICFMLLLALDMRFAQNKTVGRMMVAGAILFVMSDSILAVNKFYRPFMPAGVLIMLSYGLAQLFIVEGAVRYIVGLYLPNTRSL